MKKVKNIKYEIVICPEDDHLCGKCTYKYKEGSIYGTSNYKCLLFGNDLYGFDRKTQRCGDCKLLTERFIKMPELDEC